MSPPPQSTAGNGIIDVRPFIYPESILWWSEPAVLFAQRVITGIIASNGLQQIALALILFDDGL
jgi:hypothetical protein